MNPHATRLLVALLLVLPAAHASDDAAPSLLDTILALDTAAFDAFNHCDEEGQLQRHAGYFDQNVEFYHDTGGVTWTRAQMLENTAKYVCGNYRRERIEGTFRVHPVKDFGAISQGEHRFCQIATGTCDGRAEFTIVWKQQPAGWVMTRVLSYGHRAEDVAP